MLGRNKLVIAALGVMLGGAALASASQPGRTEVRGGGVYSGYLDTQNAYGPLLFNLHVNSFATSGDVAAMETALRKKGQDGVVSVLDEIKPTGWLQLDHEVGYPVTVLGEKMAGDSRQVVAILHRPLALGEFWFGTRSLDYPFALVVLNVDENGTGTGTLIPAARLDMDGAGKLSFEDYLRLPYRIMAVRQTGLS
jgi:hypothetical protein